MPGATHLPAFGRAQLPAWYYLGGGVVATPDNQALALPDDCCAVTLSMETGAGYYAINDAIASANSGGYIPADGTQTIGPIANHDFTLRVHSPTGTVHYQLWREA